MASSELELGLRLFQAGRLKEAADACARHLATRPEDSRALHLLGRVYLNTGRPAEALDVLNRAVALEPADVQALLSLGSALRATGDVRGAAAAFERVTSVAPGYASGWFNRGVVARDESRLKDAALAFREAARLDAGDYDAHQNVVSTIAAAVHRGETLFARLSPPRAAPAREAISIVVCSIDEDKRRRFVDRLKPHLAEREHEIVVIRDARSLSEGYRRGWEESRLPLVVFCHDDFAILSERPFEVLEAALQSVDIVGLAGSTLAKGPAVLWAGHPHIHGCITHPARDGRGFETAVMSLRTGLIEGVQTLDGVFMAMRREVPGRVGFDESTFDGFHFYDLDFTYRAARAGLKLAITTDVVALHESAGRFDAVFERYAARFRGKFPELNAPRGPNHWYGARFEDLAGVVAFSRELDGLASA